MNWLPVDADQENPTREERADDFRSRYSAISTFHACRTDNVQSYLSDGIRIVRNREIIEKANAIFCQSEFPEITEEIVEEAARGTQLHEYHGTYVVLDDRYLVEWAGHYLIYGSEKILGIAGSLRPGVYYLYQQHLTTIGKPTLFEVELPVEMVEEPDLSSLINCIIGELPGQDAPHIDFAFFVAEPIGAECIKRYWHPLKIPDPLHGHRIYCWESNRNVRTGGQMGRRKLLERT